jgi:hypothetical protein
MFLFFGSIGLSRFSSAQVKTVEALGLFASGMGCGAALCGFFVALMKPRREKGSGAEVKPSKAGLGDATDQPRD